MDGECVCIQYCSLHKLASCPCPPHSLHDLVPHAGMHPVVIRVSEMGTKPLLVIRVGEIISRFECKGFVLKGLKLFQTPEKLAQTHDFELKEKQFYPKLVKYIISSPVICMNVSRMDAFRQHLNPLPRSTQSITWVVGMTNVVHGSNGPENGE
ncbi:unnamed protein product [Sphagnum troendelagicum]